VTTEAELIRWAIVQEGRLQAATPWILLGIFVAVGALVSVIRALLDFGEREMGIVMAGTFLVIAGGFLYHIVFPGGEIMLKGDHLTVDRRFRAPVQFDLQTTEVNAHRWTGRAAGRVGISMGLQLELREGERSLTLGAPSLELSRHDEMASLPRTERPPHLILSEEDFVEILGVVWTS